MSFVHSEYRGIPEGAHVVVLVAPVPDDDVVVDEADILHEVGDILVDVEQMAEEHIEEILGGGQPQVGLDDDHKGLLTFVQKHLLESANQYDDEVLARFLAYVDELRNYLQAANPNLFAPPQPQMLPTDEGALMQSLGGRGTPPAPTQGLDVPISTKQV